MSVIAKAIYIEHRSERYLLALLLAAFCALSVAYVYLLSMSVVHVVISRETEEKIHGLHSEIATLESSYMEKQHAISMEVVERRGFAVSSEKIFLNREGASVVTQR